MTSNEDAEIRKHVYKPLKRRSPTPLYYPLAAARAAAGAGAAAPGAHRRQATSVLDISLSGPAPDYD